MDRSDLAKRITKDNYINEKILNILLQYDSEDLKQYINIINHALSETRIKLDKTNKNYTYYEGHHILPKSLFKDYENEKNNIVLLLPSEHFKCHKLLLNIFPSPEMTYAFWLMSRNNEVSAEQYEEIRKQISKLMSEKMVGVPKSEIHREHIREGRIGLSYGNLSEEHKQKISNTLKGKPPSKLNRQVCSERCKKRTGENNTQSRKVKCIEDDLVFDTVHECEEYYNILHLYRYCSTGKIHTKINKHFEYVKENE